MDPCKVQFAANSLCHWAGMADYVLIPPDRSYEITLRYAGEPPNGDSYLVIDIAGRRFPGHAWGSMFALSECSNFIAFSWMRDKFERLTAIIDVRNSRYFVLPRYVYHPCFEWPSVLDAKGVQDGYTFNGSENWLDY
ncbi:hypothetical protein THI4931_26280 [Pandoraea sputorum]|nr:hypothetical protein THI4931_26280 [Pandoraea sputorum]